jgi:hypothetical protein
MNKAILLRTANGDLDQDEIHGGRHLMLNHCNLIWRGLGSF